MEMHQIHEHFNFVKFSEGAWPRLPKQKGPLAPYLSLDSHLQNPSKILIHCMPRMKLVTRRMNKRIDISISIKQKKCNAAPSVKQ